MKKQKRVNICVNRLKYEWFARTRIDTYTNQLLVAWFLRLAMKGDSFTVCRWKIHKSEHLVKTFKVVPPRL